jgi:hypothetical protein
LKLRPIGFHAVGKFGAGNLAAFHLLLNLPGDNAFERTRFALCQQMLCLQEVVKIRTDVLLFHRHTLADEGAPSPVPIFLGRFLGRLDKGVEQNHSICTRCENHSRNSVGQPGANFPQVFVDLANQRHPERPAELNRLDVFADDPSFLAR